MSLHADTGSMEQNGKSFQQLAESLADQITIVENNKGRLAEIWRGSAAEGFNSSCANQIINLKKFIDLINEMGQNVGTAAVILSDAEAEITKMGNDLFV